MGAYFVCYIKITNKMRKGKVKIATSILEIIVAYFAI